jgi:hypothetical protein
MQGVGERTDVRIGNIIVILLNRFCVVSRYHQFSTCNNEVILVLDNLPVFLGNSNHTSRSWTIVYILEEFR